MANSDKNLIITPNIGSTTDDPKIVFSGADTSTSAQDITLRAYPTNSGTLSIEGSAGQLFSVTNSLTGTLFSVNDISGVPSIEVIDDGTVKLAQYGGNVGIGTSSPIGNLDIKGTNPIVKIIENTGTGNAKLQLLDTNNASSPTEGTELWYESSTGNSYLTSIYSGGDFIFKTANTERMRIDSSGKVGIGTNNPQVPLHLWAADNDGSDVEILRLSGASNGNNEVRMTFYPRDVFMTNPSAMIAGRLTYGISGNESGQLEFHTTTGGVVNEQMVISSTGALRFNSGYGSVATAYGCRAWVNFNGTGTVAIRGSGNVSSVTDIAAGEYQINFSTAMPDANYAAVSSGGRSDTGPTNVSGGAAHNYTTTSVKFTTEDVDGAFTDYNNQSVAIIR